MIYFNVWVTWSQTDSTKVSFVAYWNKGDSYDFKITKVKRTWEENVLVENDSSQYVANFFVLDSTTDNYTIKWKYTESIISSLDKALGKLSEARAAIDSINRKYNVTSIIYTTDTVGEFVEVINWKEISELSSKIFDEIERESIRKSPDKKDVLTKAFLPLKQLFKTRDGIEQFLLNDIQHIHFPMGYDYTITEPITYEQDYPDLVGVGPISGDVTLHFEDVDFENASCTLYENIKIDPEKAKIAIKNLLSKMGLKGKELETEIRDAELNISNSNLYQFYYNPGVPHMIRAIRNSELKFKDTNMERSDELIIELVYED